MYTFLTYNEKYSDCNGIVLLDWGARIQYFNFVHILGICGLDQSIWERHAIQPLWQAASNYVGAVDLCVTRIEDYIQNCMVTSLICSGDMHIYSIYTRAVAPRILYTTHPEEEDMHIYSIRVQILLVYCIPHTIQKRRTYTYTAYVCRYSSYTVYHTPSRSRGHTHIQHTCADTPRILYTTHHLEEEDIHIYSIRFVFVLFFGRFLNSFGCSTAKSKTPTQETIFLPTYRYREWVPTIPDHSWWRTGFCSRSWNRARGFEPETSDYAVCHSTNSTTITPYTVYHTPSRRGGHARVQHTCAVTPRILYTTHHPEERAWQ